MLIDILKMYIHTITNALLIVQLQQYTIKV